jgi:type II secretory pathway component GspD/PulD (secretin)
MSAWKKLAIPLLLACLSPPVLRAQPPARDGEMVQLNFPAEIEIQVLVDYVSNALDIKILYDEQIASKTISIKSSTPVPKSSLLPVLESALKMKGLVLADAEAPGWKRIIQAEQMPQVAPSIFLPKKTTTRHRPRQRGMRDPR